LTFDIHKIDRRRLLYVIQFIVMSVPLIYPIAIPLPIDKYSKGYYDAIEAIPEGSVVGYCNFISGGQWPLLESGAKRTAVRLWEKDCKIIFFAFSDVGVPFIDLIVEDAKKIYESRHSGETIEYDVDYIRLGYIAGLETGFAEFLRDMKGLVPNDYFGTPTASLELLKNVNTGNDIPFMVWAESGTPAPYGIRQYQQTYGGTMVEIVVGMLLPTISIYFETGQVAGAILGSAGCAQYEYLTGMPGPALRLVNALSLTTLMVLIALIVGNVEYLYEVTKGGMK
jgi:hypothetical protein